MTYQEPTLFGLAYASRLHQQIDKSSGFNEQLRCKIVPSRDLELQDRGHGRILLEWLNKWGCRITGDAFPKISDELAKWFQVWRPKLPRATVNLVGLGDRDLDSLEEAYRDLLDISEFGPTSASKTLFAVRPHAAMPWDAAIQKEFGLSGRAPERYRAMLVRSMREGRTLMAEAKRRGWSDSRSGIPTEIGRPKNTLSQLLDEYHWITITRGYVIPDRDELERWIRLATIS